MSVGQGGSGFMKITPLPQYSPYRHFGVRHNGRGKRSAAPGSVLEYRVDRDTMELTDKVCSRELPPPEPPQAISFGQGGSGFMKITPLPQYSPYRIFGVRRNGRGKRNAAPGTVLERNMKNEATSGDVR